MLFAPQLSIMIKVIAWLLSVPGINQIVTVNYLQKKLILT